MPATIALLTSLLQLGALPAGAWNRLPAHPRLFANAAQWRQAAKLALTDPVTKRLLELLQAHDEWLLTAPPVEYQMRDRGKLSGSILFPARHVQSRVIELGAMYRLTGDQRFADRALVELHGLCSLPDWNPAVFLDTAEATLAAAVGYDWLYDCLSEDDRQLLAQSIVEKGLRPSFEGKSSWLGWIKGHNNWNQVCHSGLACGALAVAEVEPELARRTVDRALAELHNSAEAYAPDGVYPEGPMYWDYGTTLHVGLVAALESVFSDRCGMDEFPGFLQTADYLTQVTGPSGRTFNYSDSRSYRGFEPILFWFAQRLDRPGIAAWERNWLAHTHQQPDHSFPRFFPLVLLWSQPASGQEPELPLCWRADGICPLAVLRSSWDDPNATWVAIKGGRAGHSHGHLDAGSFILEADGVRWAVDPGIQGYDSLYAAGIDSGLWGLKQDSPRWTVFRIGPEGHNIPRFNGAQPRVDGSVTLTGCTADAPNQVIADLTPAYRDQVVSLRRGWRLRHDRRVVIADEWTTGEQAVELSWQWLTTAKVTLDGRTAVLRQSQQTLRLTVVEPADAKLTVADTAMLLKPHDEPNPGLLRLLVTTPTPAGATKRLVVIATPGDVTGPLPEVAPLDEW